MSGNFRLTADRGIRTATRHAAVTGTARVVRKPVGPAGVRRRLTLGYGASNRCRGVCPPGASGRRCLSPRRFSGGLGAAGWVPAGARQGFASRGGARDARIAGTEGQKQQSPHEAGFGGHRDGPCRSLSLSVAPEASCLSLCLGDGCSMRGGPGWGCRKMPARAVRCVRRQLSVHGR